MPHPRETKRVSGRLWHLEDQGLRRSDALALKRHLVNTEDKKSRISRNKEGYRVWWAR